MLIPITIDGMPAQAKVLEYSPAFDGWGLNGPVDSYQDIEAPEPAWVEYELYDRRGRRAAWLDYKLENWKIEKEVTEQVLDHIQSGHDWH